MNQLKTYQMRGERIMMVVMVRIVIVAMVVTTILDQIRQKNPAQ
jgi:hypothetical protein